MFLRILLIFNSFLFFSEIAQPKDIKLTDFYFELEKALNTSSPNLPKGSNTEYLPTIGFNIEILKYGYINTKVSSETDQDQFRFVAMDNEVGIIFKHVDVYFRHFSGHWLEKTQPRYPYENTIGFRFYLYGK